MCNWYNPLFMHMLAGYIDCDRGLVIIGVLSAFSQDKISITIITRLQR